eukprot:3831660-Pleurochrysis_carterae.AAC.1
MRLRPIPCHPSSCAQIPPPASCSPTAPRGLSVQPGAARPSSPARLVRPAPRGLSVQLRAACPSSPACL